MQVNFSLSCIPKEVISIHSPFSDVYVYSIYTVYVYIYLLITEGLPRNYLIRRWPARYSLSSFAGVFGPPHFIRAHVLSHGTANRLFPSEFRKKKKDAALLKNGGDSPSAFWPLSTSVVRHSHCALLSSGQSSSHLTARQHPSRSQELPPPPQEHASPVILMSRNACDFHFNLSLSLILIHPFSAVDCPTVAWDLMLVVFKVKLVVVAQLFSFLNFAN